MDKIGPIGPILPRGSHKSSFRVARLVHDRYGRAYVDVIEKDLRHFARHPDTAVGGWIPGQVPLVHAHTAGDAHEVGHRRAFEYRAGRFRILRHVDVLLDDVSGSVDVITVQARGVIQILLDDLVVT